MDTEATQVTPEADQTPEEQPRKGRHRPLIVALALIAVIALCAGGFAWWSHNETDDAQASCAQAARDESKARKGYRTELDGEAKATEKTRPGDLKDEKTLTTLQQDMEARAPRTVSCPTPSNWFDRGGLNTATGKLDRAKNWHTDSTKTLKKDVKAVDDSRDAKTLADGQTLHDSSAGAVADEGTRTALRKALDEKDAKAVRKAMDDVNASKAAKARADQQAAQQAQQAQAAQATQQAQAQQQQAPAYDTGSHGGQPYQAPAQQTPAPQAPAQPVPGNSGGNSGQTWQEWMAAHAGPSPCKPGEACGIG